MGTIQTTKREANSAAIPNIRKLGLVTLGELDLSGTRTPGSSQGEARKQRNNGAQPQRFGSKPLPSSCLRFVFCPFLVLKGIPHLWKYFLIFTGALSKWKLRGPANHFASPELVPFFVLLFWGPPCFPEKQAKGGKKKLGSPSSQEKRSPASHPPQPPLSPQNSFG